MQKRPGESDAQFAAWFREQPVLTADQTHEEALRWGHAKRVFLAWLPFVTLTFLLAAALTYSIAFYEHAETQPFFVAYLLKEPAPAIDHVTAGSAQAAVRAVVSYAEANNVPFVNVRASKPGMIVLSDVAGHDSCKNKDTGKPVTTGYELDSVLSDKLRYVHTIDLAAAHVKLPTTIECLLGRGPSDETFAHRTITVKNDVSNDVPAGMYSQVVSVSVADVEGTELVTLRGGTANPGLPEERIVAPHHEVHAKWRQTVREEWRDVILVVIGTVIALGAAMLIEALRPLIDLFIHESK